MDSRACDPLTQFVNARKQEGNRDVQEEVVEPVGQRGRADGAVAEVSAQSTRLLRVCAASSVNVRRQCS